MTAARPQSKYRPLVIGAIALVALPLVMRMAGLTVNTASVVVILAIATMGLNLLVGFTGLTSFGHSAWFGIGAYAAALVQKHWLHDQIAVPILASMVLVAALSTVVGSLILRRRGVYFSLLTLALAALTYAIAFRWTEVTGGEDGLGGLARGSIGPVSLDDAHVYYSVVAAIAMGVLYGLLRVIRSPFGHVLVAIRENQQRASFQGYPVERYKLAAFVISAVVTGLAGALLGFQHYLVSAEAVSVPFSGELLAMVVIGGMHHILGPALGALFYTLFRELFSMWTANWLLWFGLVFVGFVLYSPGGLVGIWAKLQRRWRPPPEEAAAMNARRIHEGLPLPAFLRPAARQGTVLEVDAVQKHFGGIRAVADASLVINAGEVHALIGPNGAGKTTMYNLVSGMFAPDAGTVRLNGEEIRDLPPYRICERGLARSFQITNLFRGLPIRENLRLSLQAKHPGRFNAWRDVESYPEVLAETAELVRFLGLEGIEEIEGGELSYGGQRLLDVGIALASKPQVLLLDEPLAGLAAAERERVSKLVKTIAASIPVLIVEHDIDRVLGFSHRVTVMNQGEVLMSGTPGRGARRPARAGGLHRHRHAARHWPHRRRGPRSRAIAALLGRQRLLREEPHPQRCDARRPRRRNRRAARPQRRWQVDIAEDARRAPAAGLGDHRIRGTSHRRHAGAGHRAPRHRLRAAGAGSVRRHDRGRQPRARAPRARHRRQARRRAGASRRSSTTSRDCGRG